jgi:transcriptional regulator with XRE-family HTH domain
VRAADRRPGEDDNLQRWIDGQLEADPGLAQAAEDWLSQMKLEQQIVALREKRGLTQRQLARLLGTSQPYALMAFTSEMTPWAARANGAVTGMKLATVRAIGATFLMPLHTLEKKPGFLHEDFLTVPSSPTVSLRRPSPSPHPGPRCSSRTSFGLGFGRGGLGSLFLAR